jgi:hypothetical protein
MRLAPAWLDKCSIPVVATRTSAATGGWGIAGHANTNADIAAAARAALAGPQVT